ncbi:suppressor of fused domain protein [Bacillus mangrovi]|uniref:Suppressor of fused domain protein n=1 Tax=Metabacillus mangrovi TaxID=1491830 RepID=A0A7X2V5U0_9BACI|nr:suppressor of fused domain protein [Metabacillus mangrovi]MTH54541.1 suppressor of fused domain protein [Metabacillus mangrovi]
MSITKENKMIAKSALEAFGGKPSVSRYWDENNDSNIDLLSVLNKPFDGVTSISTIGLSEYPIEYSIDEKPLRIEIAGACGSEFEYFANVLSACAFNIINTKMHVSHGEVFKDVIKMYDSESEMKHVLFTSPFIWENLDNIDFPDKKVTWLLAVPISTEELLFAKKEGTEALEDLFEKEDIDIFNLNRQSVL